MVIYVIVTIAELGEVVVSSCRIFLSNACDLQDGTRHSMISGFFLVEFALAFTP